MIPNFSWCVIQSVNNPHKQILILLVLNIDPQSQKVQNQDIQIEQQQDKELVGDLQLKVAPQISLYFHTCSMNQLPRFRIMLHRADQFRISSILKNKNNNSIKAIFENSDNKLITLPHIPIVTSLRITKLKSGRSGNYSHQLRQYFMQSPRIVQIGEVIAIKREGSHSKCRLRHQLYSYQKSIYDYYKIDQIVYQDYNKIKDVSDKFQENKRRNNNNNNQQQQQQQQQQLQQGEEDNNERRQNQNNREHEESDQKSVKITQYGVIKDINSQLQDAYYIWPSYIVWPEVQPNFQINISPQACPGKLPALPVCYNLIKPFNEIMKESLGKVYQELSLRIFNFISESAGFNNNDFSEYDLHNYNDKMSIFASKIMNIRLKYPMNDVQSIQLFIQRLKCQSGLAVHKFDIFDFFSFSKFECLLESIGQLAPAIVQLQSLQAIKCLVLGAGQNIVGVDEAQKET